MSALANQLMVDDAINALLASPSPRWENGVLVWRYPQGVAQNAFYFRNRGHDLNLEITCWPKQKHFNLTTGNNKGRPDLCRLNQEEKRVAVIVQSRLGLVDAIATTPRSPKSGLT